MMAALLWWVKSSVKPAGKKRRPKGSSGRDVPVAFGDMCERIAAACKIMKVTVKDECLC